jgi:hypothetical protein
MDVVYVKYDANVPVGGGALRTVRKGEHWHADDPVVKAAPDAFSPDPRYGMQWTGTPPAELAEAPVEQATAGPGEKRATARRG